MARDRSRAGSHKAGSHKARNVTFPTVVSRRTGLGLAVAVWLVGCVSAGDGWQARLATPDGGAGSTLRLGLAVDESGDVFVAGSLAAGFGVAKLSGSLGSTLWSRSIRGGGALVLADGVDPVVDAGLSESGSDGAGSRSAVVRLDGASGTEVWRHTLSQGPSDDGLVTSLALDPRGEVIAAGQSRDAESNEFSLLKLAAADGRELWRYRIRPLWTTRPDATAVTTTSGGDALVAGSLWGAPGEPKLGVLKIDGLDGEEMWQSSLQAGRAGTSSGPALSARVISLDDSGDVIAAWLVPAASNGTLLVVARMDGRNGAPRWVDVDPQDDAHGLDLYLDVRGDLVLATADAAGFRVTKRASSDGRQFWQRTFDGGPRCGEGVAVSVNADADILAAGCAGPREIFVLKLRGRDGRSLWQREIGRAAGDARTLALDPNGHVLAAGYVRAVERDELVVVKLRSRDGRLPPERATESP